MDDVSKLVREVQGLAKKVEDLERAKGNDQPKWVFTEKGIQNVLRFLPEDVSPIGRYVVLYRVCRFVAGEEKFCGEPMGRVRSIEIPARCPEDAFKCVASPGIFVLDVSPVVFDAN